MLFGLALVPKTKYNVAFFLFGEGGTGKSVFLHVLRHMVGAQNVCCVPLADFNQRFATWPLTCNLLNIVGDMPTESGYGVGSQQIEGTFKEVCDGGLVSVEHKFVDRCEAPAIARSVFATNGLPHFYDRSSALWDRLRILAFDQVFRNTKQQNLNLRNEVVEDELPGIFMWALGGLAELLKLGRFPEHSRGAELKEAHRTECNPESLFLDQNYMLAEGSAVKSKELYDDYSAWMKTNGHYPKNSGKFFKAVARKFHVEKGVFWHDGASIRGFRGLQKKGPPTEEF